jgi:RNA polymerase sigma-70 factor (ECF subfamily)
VEDLSAAVRAAQGGDDAAFGALFRAVQPRLLRYLPVLVGDDAEDVASEAWLQVARDLGDFRGNTDDFRGWVTTIARNRALDHLRRRRRRPTTTGSLEHLGPLPGADNTERSALDSVDTARALALIARLPRDQAEAVMLRVVMGLDSAHAARVLGKRPGAVRTAAYRGLRNLAKQLQQGSHPHHPADPPRGTTSTQGVTDRRTASLRDTR